MPISMICAEKIHPHYVVINYLILTIKRSVPLPYKVTRKIVDRNLSNYCQKNAPYTTQKSPAFKATRTSGDIGSSYDICAFAEGALQHLNIVKVEKSLHKLG